MPTETEPVPTYGTSLYVASYQDTVPTDWTTFLGLTGFAEVTGLKTATPPQVEPVDVAVGHLKTATEEYIPGQAEPGMFEASIVYTEARNVQLEALRGSIADTTSARGRKLWAVRFPGGSGYIFKGYIKSLNVSQVQNKSTDPVMINLTIKASGIVQWILDNT